MNPAEIMATLEQAAIGLDRAATKLAEKTAQFEGTVDKAGEWTPGPKLRYEEAIAEETAGLEGGSHADRQARAVAIIRQRDPDLYADYHRLSTEINGLKSWISSKKESISARQSILSAEKVLAGR